MRLSVSVLMDTAVMHTIKNKGGLMERNNNRYEKYIEGASSFAGWYLAMNYAARFISKIIVTIVVMYFVFKYVCN